MKRTQTQHDVFFKNMMHYPGIAQDFFEKHLPKRLLTLIDVSSLHLEKPSFIDEHLNQYESDMLFSVKRINATNSTKDFLLYLLIEHQSTPDPLMPFRLVNYMMQCLKTVVKTHQENKENSLPLPLMYPMVVYNGKQPWVDSRNFFDLFGNLSELARALFFEPSQFIDICRLKESDLYKKQLSNIMLASLYRAETKKALKKKLEQLKALLLEFDHEHYRDLVHTMLIYNASSTSVDIKGFTIDSYTTFFNKIFSPEFKEITMTFGEALEKRGFEKGIHIGIQQGVQQGIEQGVQKGSQESLRQVANRMQQAGIAASVISNITGLTAEELKPILEEKASL